MSSSIANLVNPRNRFSVAQSLVRLNAAASGPAFELRFAAAQDAALAKLNKQITAINEAEFAQGKTAMLRVKITSMERQKEQIAPFQANVKANQASVKNALDKLGDLRELASSDTVAEFESKLQDALKTFESFRTAKRFNYGVTDRLRSARDDGIAELKAIVHNGFATADDVTAAQAAIDNVTAGLNRSLAIIDVNVGIANGLYKSVDVALDKAKLKVEDLVSVERKRQVAQIKQLEEQTSRLLTYISLSFEVAKSFTDALNANTIFPREVEPGSVLSLFA